MLDQAYGFNSELQPRNAPMQTLTIPLSEKVYHRLQHAARIAGKPIHVVAARSIDESLPPLMDSIPARYREDLAAMEKLDDIELWPIARSGVDEQSQRRYLRLLKKNSSALKLNAKEKEALAKLRAATDRVMLRKAYALLLLKLHGHRLPRLSDLDKWQ